MHLRNDKKACRIHFVLLFHIFYCLYCFSIVYIESKYFVNPLYFPYTNLNSRFCRGKLRKCRYWKCHGIFSQKSWPLWFSSWVSAISENPNIYTWEILCNKHIFIEFIVRFQISRKGLVYNQWANWFKIYIVAANCCSCFNVTTMNQLKIFSLGKPLHIFASPMGMLQILPWNLENSPLPCIFYFLKQNPLRN